MSAADRSFEMVEMIARMTRNGEFINDAGEYEEHTDAVMDCDDAVETLSRIISEAREVVALEIQERQAAPELAQAAARAFRLIKESGFVSGLTDDEFEGTLRELDEALIAAGWHKPEGVQE